MLSVPPALRALHAHTPPPPTAVPGVPNTHGASPQLRNDPSEHLGPVPRASYQTHGQFFSPEPPSDDLGSLHPGALLFRAAGHPPSLPTMADALAHGADVNWVNAARENATPLIQATAAVSLAHVQTATRDPLLPLSPLGNDDQ